MHEPGLKIWLRTLVGLVLLAATLASGANEIARGTPWSQPFFTRLDVSFPGSDFHARWDFHRCDCGDVLILSEETLPEGVTTGEQLLVDGRVLLQRGFGEAAGEAMLDSPMLMLQLLFVLLQEYDPVGPASLDASSVVDESDDHQPLELDTGVAHGAFPAPWKLRGEIRPAETGTARFELAFEFEALIEGRSAGRSAIHLSGLLDYRAREFPQAGEMHTDDWTTYFIRPGDEKVFAGKSFTSLAELRGLVENLKDAE